MADDEDGDRIEEGAAVENVLNDALHTLVNEFGYDRERIDALVDDVII